MTKQFDDIPQTALAWHRAGRGAVLATVVETWGSAPRRVGAQMVVSGRGEIEGSVSGGCVEAAVVSEALEALGDGEMRLLSYGVSDGDAFAAGLACGGTIRVLVEPVGAQIEAAMLADLVARRAARKPVALVVDTATQTRRLATPPEYAAQFRADRSGFAEDGVTFVGLHNPPLRLVVVGASHIAQSLVAMARIAGFDVIVVDPRGTFAAAHRFPGTDIREDFPDEVLPTLGLDPRTLVVTLSHDPKIDDPGLEAALAAPVAYIGALGSRRTHAKRVERLAARGVNATDIARIHAPVGLDIGAQTPAEIAVSVLAQAIARLRLG